MTVFSLGQLPCLPFRAPVPAEVEQTSGFSFLPAHAMIKILLVGSGRVTGMVKAPLSPLKIALVFGTRPEAIKLAPLIKRLREAPSRFHPTTIVTAQHREMLDQVLDLFSIRPDYDLDIIRPRQTLAQITANAVTGLDSLIAREKPDFVVVQGDTTTTFIGALAAFFAVLIAGMIAHRPLSAVPEYTLKFAVGVLLCTFGAFWSSG
jgi:hypothetical protein